MNKRRFDIPATLACIGTVSCWSLGPNFIKYLTGHLDSWTQNLLRYAVACLFWLPFLLLAVRTKRLERTIWRKAILPAGANIIMQSLWAAAFYYIDPAFMVLLSKSSIIWVTAFSFVLFADERPLLKSTRFWLGFALSVGGVVGVVLGKQDFAAGRTIAGIVIALAAAFMWAVYTVSARAALRGVHPHHGFSVISLYTVLGLGALAVVFGDVGKCAHMGAWPWASIVISGLTAIAFGHVLYYTAITRIGATIPALVILAQPFIVLVISNLRFGETLTALQLLFGAVLLLGSGLAIWAQQNLRRDS